MTINSDGLFLEQSLVCELATRLSRLQRMKEKKKPRELARQLPLFDECSDVVGMRMVQIFVACGWGRHHPSAF